MTQDMSGQVAEYCGLVVSLAEELANSTLARRVGAEYDDLVQEGLISVWVALESGKTPSKDVTRGAMLKWIRTIRGQVFGTPLNDKLCPPDPADLPLPLDDLIEFSVGE